MSRKVNSFDAFMAEYGDDGVVEVCSSYANESNITKKKLSKRYQVPENCISKIFRYGIVSCVVSFQTAQLIKATAHNNQAQNIEIITLTPSDYYFDELIKQRLQTVRRFEPNVVRNIVDSYIENPDLTATEVARNNGLSKKELNIIVRNAIIYNIIDDFKVHKVIEVAESKVTDLNLSVINSAILVSYTQMRKKYSNLCSKIDNLEFQIKHYDEWVSSDEEIGYSLKDLKSALDKAQKELKNFKETF